MMNGKDGKDYQATLHVCSVIAGHDLLQQTKNKGINLCNSKVSLAPVGYKIDQL